jgi:hypothetical protein
VYSDAEKKKEVARKHQKNIWKLKSIGLIEFPEPVAGISRSLLIGQAALYECAYCLLDFLMGKYSKVKIGQ